MKIKKNDKVQIIAGKDKGKEGKVLKVYAKENKVIVEGVNMVKKHTKANPQGGQGSIQTMEAPIDASNVMYLYKGKPARIGYTVEVVDGKNVKKRIAKPSGDLID